jgi:hypothetical protein
MTLSSAITYGGLGIVTALGLGFALRGYWLVSPALRWTGWIAGAISGAGVGWVVLPRVAGPLTSETQLLWTAGLVVVGAIAGRLLLPATTRLVAVVAGGLTTAGAVLAVFLGDPIVGVITQYELTRNAAGQLPALITDLVSVVSTQGVELFAIAAAAGLVGAITAVRFHDELLAAGITVIGALLVGVTVPLWEAALTGPAELGTSLQGASPSWTLLTLGVGVVVQLYTGDKLPAPDAVFS